MNCPAMPPGGGSGMKFRKPFKPNTRKITPARYRAIEEAVFISWFSLSIGSHYMAPIILISIELMAYTSRGFKVFSWPKAFKSPSTCSVVVWSVESFHFLRRCGRYTFETYALKFVGRAESRQPR